MVPFFKDKILILTFYFSLLFLAGLSQKVSELKNHSQQLEEALTLRESDLAQLRKSVEISTLDLEARDAKFMERISSLESAVVKEVEVQRDLRKQVCFTFYIIDTK